MNYKKIFKNREMRLKLLTLFNWIPDKEMIKFQYWLKTGRHLNLKKPTRYTEKLQWYKLYYKKQLMANCSDKYTVRDYIKGKGLENILNELYGVYDSVEEIDFSRFPNQFVLKKTNGGGGNDVIICNDKSKLDLKRISNWTRMISNGGGREWVYYKIKPRIIAEKFIESENNDLVDYKFFCFNGEIYYIYIISGRKLGEKVELGIFDLEYNQLPYYRCDENKMLKVPAKPENFEEMVNIARKISEDFPHVRVDLYNVKGKIIFGELTFFDGSGYQTFEPDEFDLILGSKFILPKKVNEI